MACVAMKCVSVLTIRIYCAIYVRLVYGEIAVVRLVKMRFSISVRRYITMIYVNNIVTMSGAVAVSVVMGAVGVTGKVCVWRIDIR